MPRGGRRVGAGRKKRRAVVLSMPGLDTRGRGPEPPKDPVLIPKGLTVGQRAAWKRLAPAAESRGTLTSTTVHGFALLCELVDRWQKMKARIDKDGWTFENSFGESKRHALWGVWQALTVRVEQQMARFSLSGDGKPVAAPQELENPWARIAP